ncbi:hypothetical protein E8E12_007406 [Didymella heteroderae]|uniref:Uncharacterized protein n=1 Tax=Didymella heteroderae TaxID=1769908 RepID=A0A9P4WXR0_9PLEO|nr:hypothetical protein E8E12_007406 [Didymella heteroderae]
MCETTKHASFLDLPAELRLCVYNVLLNPVLLPPLVQRSPVDGVATGLSYWDLQDRSSRPYYLQTIALPNGRNLWHSRGLILACRQTYDEMEHEVLRRHHEALDWLQATTQERHNMRLEIPTLSRLGDTMRIKIGVPSTHIARRMNITGRLAITGAAEELITSLIAHFPSFSLYLAGAEWRMHHTKTIKTEELLHKLMFDTIVQHMAGLGLIHRCKPTVNDKLILPDGYGFNWAKYVRPKSLERPRMLGFEHRF